MLLEDVKRTEPFARLARPGGSSAKTTIFQAPMAWWTALASGLSTKVDGRKNWLLVSSACLNIIGFLAISPLSSSFLEPRDVPITKDIQFARTTFKQHSPLPLHASRDAYLRTIGHILQDVSTSAWISDNYTVLPFWPSDSVTGSAPLGPLLSSSAQIWQAETQVFNTELECEPMSLLHRSINNVSYTAYNILNEPLDESGMMASIELSSEGGCVYGLAISTQVALLQSGGASWSDISKFITPPWPRTSLYSLTIDDSIPGTIYMNNSEECRDRELILFSTPWLAPSNTSYSANWTFSPDFRAAGQLCTAKYYTANITVHARLSESSSEFSFDQDEYRSKRIPVPESSFNVTGLQNVTLNDNWTSYVYPPSTRSRPAVGGLSALLGAPYNFDMGAMIDDKELVAHATKIKQRFLGEILQSSLFRNGASDTQLTGGRTTVVERRVVVIADIAIALAILLLVSFLLSLVVWTISRLRVRPLNLSRDPATTTCLTGLLTREDQTRATLNAYSQVNKAELYDKLKDRRYYTTANELHEMDASEATYDIGAGKL